MWRVVDISILTLSKNGGWVVPKCIFDFPRCLGDVRA